MVMGQEGGSDTVSEPLSGGSGQNKPLMNGVTFANGATLARSQSQLEMQRADKIKNGVAGRGTRKESAMFDPFNHVHVKRREQGKTIHRRSKSATDQKIKAMKSKYEKSLNNLPRWPSSTFKSLDSEEDNVYLECGPASRVFRLMNDPDSSIVSMYFAIGMMAIIIISVICFIVETLPSNQVYLPGCERCAPAVEQHEWLNGTDTVVDRLEWADYCTENKIRCEPRASRGFIVTDAICITMFTIEYVARLSTAWSLPCELEVWKQQLFEFKKHKRLRRTLYFMTRGMNIVDVLAILPFYIALASKGANGASTSFLRIMRLFRVVKLFNTLAASGIVSDKLNSFCDGMTMILQVFERASMAFLIAIIYTLVWVVLMGATVFALERGQWDPITGFYRVPKGSTWEIYSADQATQFTSIPATMWWVMVTVTTVGYGDVTPKTHMGQFFAIVCMAGGVFLFALPITIISATFQDLYNDAEKRKTEEKAFKEKQARTIMKCLRNSVSMHVQRCFDDWKKWAKLQRKTVEDVNTTVNEGFERQEALILQLLGQLSVDGKPLLSRRLDSAKVLAPAEFTGVMTARPEGEEELIQEVLQKFNDAIEDRLLENARLRGLVDSLYRLEHMFGSSFA